MSYRSRSKKKPSPARSVQMLDKLRNGLEEYVRLYNPVTTNWRDLKLRANKGKNRIKIVGIDDDDDDYDDESFIYDSGDDFSGNRTSLSSLMSIENDNILAPLFTKSRSSRLKRVGSFESIGTSSKSKGSTLPPLSERGLKRHPGSNPSIKSDDFYDERKQNIKTVLSQMGTLKDNMKNRLKRKPVDKETVRRMSERRASLSVIKESPFVKSSNASPTKEVIEPVEEVVASVQTASSDKSKRSQLQKRTSVGSLEEYSAFNVGGRRGARQRKRKAYHGNKIKKLSKFFIVLHRLWKTHSLKVAEMLDSFDALDALVGTKPDRKKDKDDLYFDLSLYKTTDEARIPREAKRILQTKPGTRSEDELHYLKIALRNYQAIVEYPMHMQMLLSERAWYEGYEAKRVIVREGHPPWNFYFILSGAVIVSKYDQEKNINKTVTFLGKGDSFGELAILNNTNRETTVITKEKTEFLVINHEDFRDIFMSGGLGNPKDPFLNSLWYLKGWPLHLLAKNPKKAVFNFFKRGLVLSKDTGESDWIYIIKSGSVSVYKELKYEIPDALKPKIIRPKKKKSKMGHEDRLNTIFENQMSTMYNNKTLSRLLMQPNELNIPIADSTELYGSYGYQQHHSDNIGSFHQQMSTLTDKKKEEEPESGQGSGLMSRERSLTTIDVKNKKQVSFSITGAILTKSNMKPHPPSSDGTAERGIQRRPSDISGSTSGSNKLSESVNELLNLDSSEETQNAPSGPLTQFITVQTLIKGSVFGLADVVYGAENMPRFSLVSNGAEVIMIDKRLFDDNASQRLMTDLREQIYPYPNDEALQEMLKHSINWEHNCKATFANTLFEIETRNADVHDARSELAITKPVVVT